MNTVEKGPYRQHLTDLGWTVRSLITGRMYYVGGGSSRYPRKVIVSLSRPRWDPKRLPTLACGLCLGGMVRRKRPLLMDAECPEHGFDWFREMVAERDAKGS